MLPACHIYAYINIHYLLQLFRLNLPYIIAQATSQLGCVASIYRAANGRPGRRCKTVCLPASQCFIGHLPEDAKAATPRMLVLADFLLPRFRAPSQFQ
jgi:hypothetical protein